MPFHRKKMFRSRFVTDPGRGRIFRKWFEKCQREINYWNPLDPSTFMGDSQHELLSFGKSLSVQRILDLRE